jgi:cytosine/adenosine deaminase-related metal-dependent hydrolase
VPSLLLRNATILTMDDGLSVLHGSVSVRDGRIAAVGQVDEAGHETVIDARGGYVLPGFIQTHVHLCQTLFRGFADDMPLLEWLKMRVWPMEAAHTPSTLRASVRLAAAELLRTGTTSVLTMETVHDTDVVFESLAEVGLRATVGKCMMDSDSDVPRRLQEETRASIDESLGLKKRWHGAANGRLRAAFAPRFAVSCSRELLEAGGRARGIGAVARAYPRVGESRRGRVRPAHVRRTVEHGVSRRHRPRGATPLHRALRLGHRRRAVADGRARRQGAALPRLEPEARVRGRPCRRDAGARDLGLARRRWRRV